MKHILILTLVWFLLVLVGLFLGYSIFGQNKLQEISRNGIGTTGIVTKKEPENHQYIHYDYSVYGKTYSGVGSGGDGTSSFEDIKLGQIITVTYNSATPQESYLGHPQKYVEINYLLIIITALAVSIPPITIITIIYYVILKNSLLQTRGK